MEAVGGDWIMLKSTKTPVTRYFEVFSHCLKVSLRPYKVSKIYEKKTDLNFQFLFMNSLSGNSNSFSDCTSNT